jgi:cytoskeleton protein RodZ
LPLGQRYGKQNRNSRITLRLRRSTRVAVQGTPNRILIDRTFDAGDTYRVPNMVGLKLSAVDAGAVELILDDTTVGFAGKDGAATKGLSLDPTKIAQR